MTDNSAQSPGVKVREIDIMDIDLNVDSIIRIAMVYKIIKTLSDQGISAKGYDK